MDKKQKKNERLANIFKYACAKISTSMSIFFLIVRFGPDECTSRSLFN